MTRIQTCIIEKNALMREGLKSLLDQSDFDPDIEICGIENIAGTECSNCGLAIVGTDKSAGPITNAIRDLKAAAPDIRIVILCESLDRALIAASFSAGADGFLLKDISAKALIASLNLIMAGEKVFPTSMDSLVTSGWTQWEMNAGRMLDRDKDAEFSPRTIEIIRCLARGYSNKLIARDLGITESTVKVHLKAILRKLELENRTQVAIWAVNNGIKPIPEKRAQDRDLRSSLH